MSGNFPHVSSPAHPSQGWPGFRPESQPKKTGYTDASETGESYPRQTVTDGVDQAKAGAPKKVGVHGVQGAITAPRGSHVSLQPTPPRLLNSFGIPPAGFGTEGTPATGSTPAVNKTAVETGSSQSEELSKSKGQLVLRMHSLPSLENRDLRITVKNVKDATWDPDQNKEVVELTVTRLMNLVTKADNGSYKNFHKVQFLSQGKDRNFSMARVEYFDAHGQLATVILGGCPEDVSGNVRKRVTDIDGVSVHVALTEHLGNLRRHLMLEDLPQYYTIENDAPKTPGSFKVDQLREEFAQQIAAAKAHQNVVEPDALPTPADHSDDSRHTA